MNKILVIEDDQVLVRIYRTYLERAGCTVEVATDGPGGLARIQEWKPEGVILDLMLPKMPGIEILKQIRALPDFATLPIAVYTNAFVPSMIQDAKNAGATHVFNKSEVKPNEILDALRKGPTP